MLGSIGMVTLPSKLWRNSFAGMVTAVAQILASAFSAIQKCWKNRIASLDTPIDTLIKISTQRSPIINTVSQTLMFQIRGVSIENQCVAVPDVPNQGCVDWEPVCRSPWRSKLGRACQLWSSPEWGETIFFFYFLIFLIFPTFLNHGKRRGKNLCNSCSNNQFIFGSGEIQLHTDIFSNSPPPEFLQGPLHPLV